MESKIKRSRSDRQKEIKLRRLKEQLSTAERLSKDAPSDKGRIIMKKEAARLSKQIQKMQDHGN